MAKLQVEDGKVYTEVEEITRELAPLHIQIHRWAIADDPQLRQLLAKDNLDEDEKQQVLKAFDGYFEQLKQTAGYQFCDLIVLHPHTPNLDALLAKFDKIHTHDDDEVRYIVAGEAVFGFVRPDGSQVELTVQPEEYINVPAGTEHWFVLTPARRVKAVRYFTGTEGWVPKYTGTPIRRHQVVA
jgi:1,2-dihydroxy-3-keto-5-methylthiopentene dioxygenase